MKRPRCGCIYCRRRRRFRSEWRVAERTCRCRPPAPAVPVSLSNNYKDTKREREREIDRERERECVYVYQHLLVVLAGADEERGARRVRAHVFQYRLVVLNLRESITYLSHFLSHTLSSYVWMRSHTSSCWRGAVQTGSTSLGPKPSSGTFSPSS